MVKSNHGIEHMAGALGSLSFKLPYSEEVEEQTLAGNLLADLTLKNSRLQKKNENCKGGVRMLDI